MNKMVELPFEAQQSLLIVQRCFASSLVAVYLHGSAVGGGLRPDSDVDVLVIIDQPMTYEARTHLLSKLMKISRHPGEGGASRPIELIVFQRADLSASVYPARSEFVYGEWLREAFKGGEVPEPVSDPELTLLLAQARREARPMVGPGPDEILPVIPEADIHRAIGDALPALLAALKGDERNVLLTLARMWRTLTTGEFVPKDVAAEWAIARLPPDCAAVLAYAREAYLGIWKDDWRDRHQEARSVADSLAARVTAMAPLQ